jgi:sterol desaturase/sphingolipid hydroxylase (fatty acid hydroxylase superfamily)
VDTTYSKAVAFAVPVFLALIALEIILDRKRRANYYRFADSLNSLSCGIVSTGNRVFLGFIGLFIYEWIVNHLAPVHLPANHWATWIYALVLYDFCYYWNHRFGHTIGFFWASHVVHHQSEEFNLTTALRQAGTGGITGWIFYVPLALSGVPLGVYLMVGVIQLFYQFWPHTRVIDKMGILDRWIQTPSNHRVHHAQNDIYLDRNYVGIFVIWDHLFGSFQEELDQEPCIYGIRGQLKSWNPLWANFHYYWAMLKDCFHAASWADKVRVWYMPPGWRPADVAARFPKPAYDPRNDFSRFDPQRSTVLTIYALVQFVALMAANSHFLGLLPKQSLPLNLAYFSWIVVTLVCIGGVLENRRAFLYAEAARLLLTAVAILAAGEWFGGVRNVIPIIAVLVTSLIVIGFYLRASAAKVSELKYS